MIDRSRAWLLTWASIFTGLLALLTALVVGEWQRLITFDVDVSTELTDWTRQYDGLVDALQIVETATDTIAAVIATALIAVILLTKGQRRAAIYTVGVVAGSSAITHLMKWLVDRDRPSWHVLTEQYTNGSYPSGHATYIVAIAGVLLVLSQMFLRRASARHTVTVLLVLLVLLVFADRIHLGRHFPSDVVAGALVSIVCILVGLALFSPQPKLQVEAAEIPVVASVPASSRDLHVVLNPIKVDDVGQFQAIVGAMAAEGGWNEPVWHLTTVEDPGTGMAHAASVAGADLVIVCGGDGTVREVCAELAGTGIPVGIVPAGTGNLLARNLDIPLYIRSAIDVALTGQDRAIDMVDVSGDGFERTHFMVMAGMGFDAAIMEGVNEDIKKKVGWLAYVLSGMKSLMFPAVRVEISVDDQPFTKHRARTVVVGNVGFLQAGMPLLPDATIDDGVIDVVLLHPKRFLSWLPIVWRVMAKRNKTDETLDRMTGRKVVVRAASDTPRQLDGDSIGPGRELVMECVHGRLLVRVPR
ncbi:diacylglycerol kinase family protein [Nocardioides sp. Bht2]|uniref:diacylglycerol kinase family protein n=1 Tax=Nocardioides sp. Bht2 TaxID=3392297 RepID=UPI0039B4BE49